MGHKTFIGGVHPYDGKELSKDSPIKEVLPKGDMVYPVSQHIGAPAKPVVAVGDTVLKGQMIAEAVALFHHLSIHQCQERLRLLRSDVWRSAIWLTVLLSKMMACLLRQHMRASRMSLRFQRKKSSRRSRMRELSAWAVRFPYTC